MNPAPSAPPPLLDARDIVRRFGGITALDGVSLKVSTGQIVGLIGPNGAGKTSFFNIITGIYTADQGSVWIKGQLLPPGAHQAVSIGLARTFQNVRLFRQLSVLENVMVGRHVRTTTGVWGAMLGTKRSQKEESAIREYSMHLLSEVGLDNVAYQQAQTLPYGAQRRLEIARALATEPCILALDEPVAGMNESETASLQELLQKVRSQGIAILVIEHDMRMIMSLCDHIVVLNYGKKIAEGGADTIQKHPAVIEAYLGAGNTLNNMQGGKHNMLGGETQGGEGHAT